MARNKTTFQKGVKKEPTVGRKKGTPNKRTAEANAILERAMLELSGTLEEDVKLPDYKTSTWLLDPGLTGHILLWWGQVAYLENP